MDGWKINRMDNYGLRILVNPIIALPIYELYITYKNCRPTNSEIKLLYDELTKSDSIVTKAHKMNIPVESYIKSMNEN